MYVESTESNENYPFLLVSLGNSIVNFVNFLTCKQEKSTCLCIVHLTKTCLEPLILFTYCISFQDIPSPSALDAFHKWICSACSSETPLLLCSGMLLTCDIPQGRPALQISCADNYK